MKTLGGYFARYHGKLYKSNPVAATGRVPLVAHGQDAPEPDFDLVRPGVWRKVVPREDVTELYELSYKCTYRGLDCSAARETDDGRIEVMYLIGNAYAAREAGMTEVDRGVFQALVDRSELADLHEVRRDL